MKLGFLIIASEVLDGKIADLNTKILADFLRDKQLEIHESMVVRDHRDAILRALTLLAESHDIIITSGGLGPTQDDITKEMLGIFLNKKVVFNQDALKIAEDNYARFGRTFPGREHGYAWLPEDFTPLSNSTGFAPGFYTQFKNKILFSAPGVPREFRSMLADHLEKLVVSKSQGYLKHVIIRTKNIPEEKIFGEVDPSLWSKLESLGEVSSLPVIMGVDIGVKIKANSVDELETKEQQIHRIFETSPIFSAVWASGLESLEEKIIRIANQKKIRFGFAESATGGLCSHRLTSIPGSSQSFMGSVICYDERIKETILGVRSSTLRTHTAVSSETATEMAQGLLEKFNLDIAISITGYAGPGGGTSENPVGTVYLATAIKGKRTTGEVFKLKGDREVLKQRFSQAALYSLLDEVEKFA
jgi:nicotinamide-nucleotide amidase